MNYRDYQKQYQLGFEDEILVAYLVSQKWSYLVNCLFFRTSLVPNIITLFMLFAALLGGACYALPGLSFKVVGYLLMQTWFMLDCWDGEVARQTKKFSRYGKEFDYLVHLLAQPIMMYGIYRSTSSVLARQAIPYYIVADTVKRGLFNLHFSRNHDDGPRRAVPAFRWPRRVVNYLIKFPADEPNFILIMPLFIFAGCTRAEGTFSAVCLLVDLLLILRMSLGFIQVYLKTQTTPRP